MYHCMCIQSDKVAEYYLWKMMYERWFRQEKEGVNGKECLW